MELTPAGTSPVLVSDIYSARAQAWNNPLMLPINTALNLVDTTVNSVTFGTFENEAGSLFPTTMSTYHAQRPITEIASGVAGLLAGVGAGTRAAQFGGRVSQLAVNSGMSPRAAAFAFANADQVRQYDAIMSTARQAMARGVGRAGFTVPNVSLSAGRLDEGADALRSLTGAQTYEDAARWASRARTRNGVVEGLWQEAGIYALQNQNEFLFPPDQGMFPLLAFAGVGVGINVGMEHILGRASRRVGIQAAGRAAAEEMELARVTGMYSDALGNQGHNLLHWQAGLASVYVNQRADRLLASVDAIIQAGGGGLTREAIVQQLGNADAAARNALTSSLNSINRSVAPEPTLRSGHGTFSGASSDHAISSAEISAVQERIYANPNALVGLRHFENAAPVTVSGRREPVPGVMERWDRLDTAVEASLDRARRAEREALKSGDPKEIQAAHDALREAMQAQNEVRRVRPAIIETTGTVNYNVDRMVPYAELPNANVAVRQDRSTHVWEHGGAVRMRPNGEFSIAEGRTAVPVNHRQMDAAQMSEAYTLVGKLAGNDTAANQLLGDLLNNPNRSWIDLPPQILDAIAEGAIKIPANSANPALVGMQQSIAAGVPQLVSLMHKLDWWKASADNFDMFDLEKILNLRLTDDLGQPNGLGRVFQAWRVAPTEVSALSAFGREAAAHRGVDSLTSYLATNLSHFAAAFHDIPEAALRDTLQDGIEAGMRGIDALQMHTKPRGVGALYEQAVLPTASELGRARLAQLNNSMSMNTLLASQNPIIASVSRVRQDNPELFSRATDVASLVVDDTRTRNSLLAQRTFQERGNAAVEAAAALWSAVRRVANPVIERTLIEIAQARNVLFKHKDWSVISAGISNAKHATSRGVALAGQFYTPGLNKLDISRPGAVHLLDSFGDLKGAPARDGDWHLFDLAVAANEGRYVPIELHRDAAEFLNHVVHADRVAFDAINTLRSSKGLPPLEELNGHLPLTNFNRYEMRYIADAAGRIQHYVAGKNAKEADQLLQEALERLNRNNPSDGFGYRHMDAARIQEYYDVHDQVFMRGLKDMSGIKQTGTSGGRNAAFALDLSGDIIDDMVVALRNTYDDVVRRTVAGHAAQPLAEAEAMLRRTPGTNKAYFNTIENWSQILLGQSKTAENATVTQVHNTITTWANGAIGKLGGNMPTPLRDALAWLNNPRGLAENQRKAVQHLVDNYEPMKHLLADDDLRPYLKIDRSVDSYRLASTLQAVNKGTTYAFLQHFNIAHPILNITGAMVSSPAVRQQFMPRAGETAENFARRVGPLADVLDKDAMIATPSPQRIMIEGFEHVFNNSAAMKAAVDGGFIEPNLLEELNALNNIRPSRFTEALEGIAKWTDFLNMGVNRAMQATGREPSAFTISERSETFTRAWLHMQGYVIASRGGKEGITEGQKHLFAHQFANQNIADFSPNLRGDAFRGVAGIPFGLFQSYAVNLYQRMFRYIEDGNKRALAVQLATQGAMFGVGSLPGWNQVNNLYFASGSDTRADRYGATTLNERLYSRLGKDVSDVLMTGSLSNLPRLVNLLPGEQGAGSLSLYTSGDMNFRAPTIPPAVGLATQLLAGGSELLKRSYEEIGHAVRPGERADPSRIVEVLAHYAPSRGYRSMTDLLLGERMDRNGNLLMEDTRTGMGVLSRLLGTRTHDELMVQQAAWQNSAAQSQRISDLGRLRHHMLNRVRAGDMSEDEAAGYLARYLARGGSDESWGRWLNYTTEMALNTRDQRLLDKLTGRAGELMGYEIPAASRIVNATGERAARPMQ